MEYARNKSTLHFKEKYKKKSGKYKLARLKDLSKPADQESVSFTQDYDEVKSRPGIN